MEKENTPTPLSELANTIIRLYTTPGSFISEMAWLIDDARESKLRDNECIIEACILLLIYVGRSWADATKGNEQSCIEKSLKPFIYNMNMKDLYKAVKECEEEVIRDADNDFGHILPKQQNIYLFTAFCKTEFYLNNPAEFEAIMRENNYLSA